MGITLLSSVAVSLLIVWYLMPKPILSVTYEQIVTYQAGQAMQATWPKLSKRQQKWLLAVADGKANNEKFLQQILEIGWCIILFLINEILCLKKHLFMTAMLVV
jgi:hypothetical protein